MWYLNVVFTYIVVLLCLGFQATSIEAVVERQGRLTVQAHRTELFHIYQLTTASKHAVHRTSLELVQSETLWSTHKQDIWSSTTNTALSTLFVDVNLEDGHPSKPKLKKGIYQFAFCSVETQPNNFQLLSGANSFASASLSAESVHINLQKVMWIFCQQSLSTWL